MQPEKNDRPHDSHGRKTGGERSHRRSHQHEEHEQHLAHDESNWLVSYADMMTLLFGFFVLMYSFSKVDKEKFDIVSKDLVKYFGGEVPDPGFPSGLAKIAGELTSGFALEGVDESLVGKAEGEGAAETVTGQKNEVSVVAKGDSLIITLGSDVLFASGSARPTEKTVAAVNRIAETLKTVPVELIEVEGHTDGDAIASALFPSNWELSTARSSSIVRLFQRVNFPASQLKATGYADSRPLVPEKDANGAPLKEAKLKNRRVVINIKTKPDEKMLNERLTKSGLDWQVQKGDAVDHGGMAGDNEITDLQTRYESMNRKLQEAQDRLKEAKEKQTKLKELEKLAKKTEEMEKKVQETERQTQEALENAKKMLNNEKAR